MKLICDANIVIETHRFGLWDSLVSHNIIYITSSVTGESQFYMNDSGEKIEIDLEPYIKEGKIQEIRLDVDEADKIRVCVSKQIEIQIGEAESMAAMLKSDYEDAYFCTTDKRAVFATYLLSIMPRVLSLQQVFHKRRKLKLPLKCTKKLMEKWKSEAIYRFSPL